MATQSTIEEVSTHKSAWPTPALCLFLVTLTFDLFAQNKLFSNGGVILVWKMGAPGKISDLVYL